MGVRAGGTRLVLVTPVPSLTPLPPPPPPPLPPCPWGSDELEPTMRDMARRFEERMEGEGGGGWEGVHRDDGAVRRGVRSVETRVPHACPLGPGSCLVPSSVPSGEVIGRSRRQGVASVPTSHVGVLARARGMPPGHGQSGGWRPWRYGERFHVGGGIAVGSVRSGRPSLWGVSVPRRSNASVETPNTGSTAASSAGRGRGCKGVLASARGFR